MFPQLNIRVKPKRGAALLWANVKAEDPNKVEPQISHTGMEVRHGLKLVANVWVRQYDYHSIFGCTYYKELLRTQRGLNPPLNPLGDEGTADFTGQCKHVQAAAKTHWYCEEPPPSMLAAL